MSLAAMMLCNGAIAEELSRNWGPWSANHPRCLDSHFDAPSDLALGWLGASRRRSGLTSRAWGSALLSGASAPPRRSPKMSKYRCRRPLVLAGAEGELLEIPEAFQRSTRSRGESPWPGTSSLGGPSVALLYKSMVRLEGASTLRKYSPCCYELLILTYQIRSWIRCFILPDRHRLPPAWVASSSPGH